MKDSITSKISNVFIEIIILIVFFSVAAVIIFKVHAVTITNNCENLVMNNALINSNSIISMYKSGLDIEECVNRVFEKNNVVEKVGEKYVVNMDMGFIVNNKGNVHLIISNNIKYTKCGRLESINLDYLYNDKTIYNIEGKRYEEE